MPVGHGPILWMRNFTCKIRRNCHGNWYRSILSRITNRKEAQNRYKLVQPQTERVLTLVQVGTDRSKNRKRRYAWGKQPKEVYRQLGLWYTPDWYTGSSEKKKKKQRVCAVSQLVCKGGIAQGVNC